MAILNSAGQSIVDVILGSVAYQDDPKNRIITEVEVEVIADGCSAFYVKSNCDGWAEDVKELFTFNPDKCCINPTYYIGKTEEEARFAADYYKSVSKMWVPRVEACEIIAGRYRNTVMAQLSNGCIVELFSYYPDEISFSTCEFIGRTEEECDRLYHDRDIAYLRR